MAESKGTILQLAPRTTNCCDFLGVSLWVTKASQPCLMTGVWKVWDFVTAFLVNYMHLVHLHCCSAQRYVISFSMFQSTTVKLWADFHFLIVTRNLWKNALCDCACASVHVVTSEVYRCYKRCNRAKLIGKVRYMELKIFRAAHLKWYISEANTLLFMQLGTPTFKNKTPRNPPNWYFFNVIRWLSSHQMPAFLQSFIFYIEES